MTWPFENDTSGIVKRISNRSISANTKKKYLYCFDDCTCQRIAICDCPLWLWGYAGNAEPQPKTAQIMYHAISEQQGQELYKQEEIAWVGNFLTHFLNR